MNSALGGIADHGSQIPVHEWLAADEEQVTDMIPHSDINDVLGFLQSHAPALFWIESIDCKAAKITFRVADVRDRELKIPRPAV
jgi:hypothetical protein